MSTLLCAACGDAMTPAEAISSLPNSIRVGPFDFAIIKEPGHVSESKRQFGECSTLAQTISIRVDMVNTVKVVDTIWHETLHAVYWAYGIENEDKEERLMGTLATALTALHRDNLWFAPWITAALGGQG